MCICIIVNIIIKLKIIIIESITGKIAIGILFNNTAYS